VLGHDCEEETAGASDDELVDDEELPLDEEVSEDDAPVPAEDESPSELSADDVLSVEEVLSTDVAPLDVDVAACLPASATVPHVPASRLAAEAATTRRIRRRRSVAVGAGMANTLAAARKQPVKRA
jgi:hypothetical protein